MAEASHWLTTQFPGNADLENYIAEIKRNRRTGTLTINFSQGAPGGGFTWKERYKGSNGSVQASSNQRATGPYDPSELHLVEKIT